MEIVTRVKVECETTTLVSCIFSSVSYTKLHATLYPKKCSHPMEL